MLNRNLDLVSYITMATDPRPGGEGGANAFIWETLIRGEVLV